MRPLISAAPAYGASLTTADICRHDMRQIELIEAVQHLFDLRFFTDEATRTVRIAPDAIFWDECRKSIRSDRTERSEPVV